MKCLSIREPWASLIASGQKTIETRTWKTNYRGPVLLHASKHPKGPLSGMVFAKTKILDCRKMVKEDELNARCLLYEDANSWFLDKIEIIEPFQMKGQLGLFEVDY